MGYEEGQILIYTDTDNFTEFLGKVGKVEESMISSEGQHQVIVRWMTDVNFNGIETDLSKFPASSFDSLSMTVGTWQKE